MSWFQRQAFSFCINLEDPCKTLYITNGLISNILLALIILGASWLIGLLIYKWVKK